jgi:hypothetical protein
MFLNSSAVFWRGYAEKFISALVLFVMVFTTVLPPSYVYAQAEGAGLIVPQDQLINKEEGAPGVDQKASTVDGKPKGEVTGASQCSKSSQDAARKTVQTSTNQQAKTDAQTMLNNCAQREKTEAKTCWVQTNQSVECCLNSECTLQEKKSTLAACTVGVCEYCRYGKCTAIDPKNISLNIKPEEVGTALQLDYDKKVVGDNGDVFLDEASSQSKLQEFAKDQDTVDQIREIANMQDYLDTPAGQTVSNAGVQDTKYTLEGPTDTGFNPEALRPIDDQAIREISGPDRMRQLGIPEYRIANTFPNTGFVNSVSKPFDFNSVPAGGFGVTNPPSPIPTQSVPSALTTNTPFTGQVPPTPTYSILNGPQSPPTYSNPLVEQFFGGPAPPINFGPTVAIGSNGELVAFDQNGNRIPLNSLSLPPNVPSSIVPLEFRTVGGQPLLLGPEFGAQLGEIAGSGQGITTEGILNIASGRSTPQQELVSSLTGAPIDQIRQLEPNVLTRVLAESDPEIQKRIIGEAVQAGEEKGPLSGFTKTLRNGIEQIGDVAKRALESGVAGARRLGESLGLRTPDPTEGDITSEDLGFNDFYSDLDNPTGQSGTSESDIRNQISDARDLNNFDSDPDYPAVANLGGSANPRTAQEVGLEQGLALRDELTQREPLPFIPEDGFNENDNLSASGSGSSETEIRNEILQARIDTLKEQIQTWDDRSFLDRVTSPLQGLRVANARRELSGLEAQRDEIANKALDDAGIGTGGQVIPEALRSNTGTTLNYDKIDPSILSSEEIKKVQESLGFTGKDVDGVWGPKTEEARQIAVVRELEPAPFIPEDDPFTTDDNLLLDGQRLALESRNSLLREGIDSYKKGVESLVSDRKKIEFDLEKNPNAQFNIPDEKIDLDEDGNEIGVTNEFGERVGGKEALAFIDAQKAQYEAQIAKLGEEVSKNESHVGKILEYRNGPHHNIAGNEITPEEAIVRDYAQISLLQNDLAEDLNDNSRIENEINFLQGAINSVDPNFQLRLAQNNAELDSINAQLRGSKSSADFLGEGIGILPKERNELFSERNRLEREITTIKRNIEIKKANDAFYEKSKYASDVQKILAIQNPDQKTAALQKFLQSEVRTIGDHYATIEDLKTNGAYEGDYDFGLDISDSKLATEAVIGERNLRISRHIERVEEALGLAEPNRVTDFEGVLADGKIIESDVEQILRRLEGNGNFVENSADSILSATRSLWIGPDGEIRGTGGPLIAAGFLVDAWTQGALNALGLESIEGQIAELDQSIAFNLSMTAFDVVATSVDIATFGVVSSSNRIITAANRAKTLDNISKSLFDSTSLTSTRFISSELDGLALRPTLADVPSVRLATDIDAPIPVNRENVVPFESSPTPQAGVGTAPRAPNQGVAFVPEAPGIRIAAGSNPVPSAPPDSARGAGGGVIPARSASPIDLGDGVRILDQFEFSGRRVLVTELPGGEIRPFYESTGTGAPDVKKAGDINPFGGWAVNDFVTPDGDEFYRGWFMKGVGDRLKLDAFDNTGRLRPIDSEMREVALKIEENPNVWKIDDVREIASPEEANRALREQSAVLPNEDSYLGDLTSIRGDDPIGTDGLRQSEREAIADIGSGRVSDLEREIADNVASNIETTGSPIPLSQARRLTPEEVAQAEQLINSNPARLLTQDEVAEAERLFAQQGQSEGFLSGIQKIFNPREGLSNIQQPGIFRRTFNQLTGNTPEAKTDAAVRAVDARESIAGNRYIDGANEADDVAEYVYRQIPVFAKIDDIYEKARIGKRAITLGEAEEVLADARRALLDEHEINIQLVINDDARNLGLDEWTNNTSVRQSQNNAVWNGNQMYVREGLFDNPRELLTELRREMGRIEIGKKFGGVDNIPVIRLADGNEIALLDRFSSYKPPTTPITSAVPPSSGFLGNLNRLSKGVTSQTIEILLSAQIAISPIYDSARSASLLSKTLNSAPISSQFSPIARTTDNLVNVFRGNPAAPVITPSTASVPSGGITIPQYRAMAGKQLADFERPQLLKIADEMRAKGYVVKIVEIDGPLYQNVKSYEKEISPYTGATIHYTEDTTSALQLAQRATLKEFRPEWKIKANFGYNAYIDNAQCAAGKCEIVMLVHTQTNVGALRINHISFPSRIDGTTLGGADGSWNNFGLSVNVRNASEIVPATKKATTDFFDSLQKNLGIKYTEIRSHAAGVHDGEQIGVNYKQAGEGVELAQLVRAQKIVPSQTLVSAPTRPPDTVAKPTPTPAIQADASGTSRTPEQIVADLDLNKAARNFNENIIRHNEFLNPQTPFSELLGRFNFGGPAVAKPYELPASELRRIANEASKLVCAEGGCGGMNVSDFADLLIAQVRQESGVFDPRLLGEAGELGLTQIKPGTARLFEGQYKTTFGDNYGLSIRSLQINNAFDLAKRSIGMQGVLMGKYLVDCGGGSSCALASYNGGPGGKGSAAAQAYAKATLGKLVQGQSGQPLSSGTRGQFPGSGLDAIYTKSLFADPGSSPAKPAVVTAPKPAGPIIFEYTDKRGTLVVSSNFDPNKPFARVLFYPGHNISSIPLSEQIRLAQIQISDAGVNVVGVIPNTGAVSADGVFVNPRTLESALQDTSIRFAELTGATGGRNLFDNAPTVVISYSGGFLGLDAALLNTTIAKNIRGIVMLDSAYGNANRLSNIAEFAKQNLNNAFYVNVSRPGTTVANKSNALQRLIGTPTEKVLPDKLLPGKVVFVSDNARHSDYLTNALGGSPIKTVLQRIEQLAETTTPTPPAPVVSITPISAKPQVVVSVGGREFDLSQIRSVSPQAQVQKLDGAAGSTYRIQNPDGSEYLVTIDNIVSGEAARIRRAYEKGIREGIKLDDGTTIRLTRDAEIRNGPYQLKTPSDETVSRSGLYIVAQDGRIFAPINSTSGLSDVGSNAFFDRTLRNMFTDAADYEQARKIFFERFEGMPDRFEQPLLTMLRKMKEAGSALPGDNQVIALVDASGSREGTMILSLSHEIGLYKFNGSPELRVGIASKGAIDWEKDFVGSNRQIVGSVARFIGGEARGDKPWVIGSIYLRSIDGGKQYERVAWFHGVQNGAVTPNQRPSSTLGCTSVCSTVMQDMFTFINDTPGPGKPGWLRENRSGVVGDKINGGYTYSFDINSTKTVGTGENVKFAGNPAELVDASTGKPALVGDSRLNQIYYGPGVFFNAKRDKIATSPTPIRQPGDQRPSDTIGLLFSRRSPFTEKVSLDPSSGPIPGGLPVPEGSAVPFGVSDIDTIDGANIGGSRPAPSREGFDVSPESTPPRSLRDRLTQAGIWAGGFLAVSSPFFLGDPDNAEDIGREVDPPTVTEDESSGELKPIVTAKEEDKTPRPGVPSPGPGRQPQPRPTDPLNDLLKGLGGRGAPMGGGGMPMPMPTTPPLAPERATTTAGTLTPRLACSDTVAIVNGHGTTTVRWACTSGATSRGIGFETKGTASGQITFAITETSTTTDKYRAGIECIQGGNIIGKRNCEIEIVRPILSLIANPSRIKPGDTSQIIWSSVGVVNSLSACIVYSSNGAITKGGPSGTVDTLALTRNTEFAVACEVKGGEPVTSKLVVDVIGDSGPPIRALLPKKTSTSTGLPKVEPLDLPFEDVVNVKPTGVQVEDPKTDSFTATDAAGNEVQLCDPNIGITRFTWCLLNNR